MNVHASRPPDADGCASDAVRTVLRYVESNRDAAPVDERWVPGARRQELVQLGALGALAGAVIRRRSYKVPAFDTGNLRAWVSRPEVTDPFAIEALTLLLRTDAEQNLAEVYSSIVSGRSRRTLGTFFTPAAEANWMVRTWSALFPPPRTVVDVGAGVGIFSSRAATAWPTAEVFAVDINPVTLGLLALTEPALPARAKHVGRVIPVEADFTKWVETEWASTPGPRLILGNPPYTRLQLMPAEDRARLTAVGGGLVGTRAALSAIITAQSLRALRAEDGLALLLPAQWLEADYASALRRSLWEQTTRRAELRIFGEQLFSDATVDAVALILGPATRAPQPLTVSTAAERKTVDQRDSEEVGGFDRLISAARKRAVRTLPDASDTFRRFATVRRGVATGANRFFILDERAVRASGLTTDVLTPLLRRTRSAPDVLTHAEFAQIPDVDRRWLLTARRDQVDEGGPLKQYLAAGEKQQIPTAYLCRVRPEWFDLYHDITIPDVIVGQASKTTFKIVENPMGASISNNLYGFRWLPTTPELQRRHIVEWLRSDEGQTALRAVARVQATGLLKLELRALADLQVPESVKAGAFAVHAEQPLR